MRPSLNYFIIIIILVFVTETDILDVQYNDRNLSYIYDPLPFGYVGGGPMSGGYYVQEEYD